MSSETEPPAATVNLGRASAMLASGTIVSRILGFIRVAVLAAAVGQASSAAADAFGVANQLPNSIYALVAGGVLSAVLVPQIVRAGLHADGGQRFINRIITLGVVIFLGVTLIATLAAPALISLYAQQSVEGGRGFSPAALSLATAFAYWCLPQIFFYALYSLLSEVLNARNMFGPFTWAPVLNNVVAIGGLVAFMLLFGGAGSNSSPSGWGIDRILLLAGTATLGIAAQALVLFLFWRRAGLHFRPEFRWRGVGLGSAGRAAGWLFGMILVMQLAGLVSTRVATLGSAEGASVATLQASWLVFMLPHSVVAVSIATAYFTRMSGHAARGELVAVREDLSASLRGIGLLIVFSTVALAVVAYPFARFFEDKYGNIAATGNVILAFLPGLVLYSILFVIQRVFYALDETRTAFFMQCVQSGLYVIGALACTALPAQWIGVGLALVTAVSGSTQAVIAIFVVRRRLGGIDGALILKRHLQYFGLALLSGVAGLGVLLALGGLSADSFVLSGRLQALGSIALTGTTMAAVYTALLLLVRNPELTSVASTIRSRFRPGVSE
jgi:putative peptidoglycan lipid II flippase